MEVSLRMGRILDTGQVCHHWALTVAITLRHEQKGLLWMSVKLGVEDEAMINVRVKENQRLIWKPKGITQ